MHEQINYYQSKLNYEIDAFDLMDAIKRGERIVIIDARSGEAFEQEHIIGAVNMPHRQMTSESTSNFTKEIQYITYCDGIGCNASTKGALQMALLGFNVKELIGGIDWWKRDGYPVEGSTAAGDKSVCGC